MNHGATEQGVEADEAKGIGASQLNSSVRRTFVSGRGRYEARRRCHASELPGGSDCCAPGLCH